MTIVAILVALAVLYWLGSLAYAYFANSTERARLNNNRTAGHCLARRGFARGPAHGDLFALR